MKRVIKSSTESTKATLVLKGSSPSDLQKLFRGYGLDDFSIEGYKGIIDYLSKNPQLVYDIIDYKKALDICSAFVEYGPDSYYSYNDFGEAFGYFYSLEDFHNDLDSGKIGDWKFEDQYYWYLARDMASTGVTVYQLDNEDYLILKSPYSLKSHSLA